MFCIKCGAQLPEQSQFCYKCGEKTISDEDNFIKSDAQKNSVLQQNEPRLIEEVENDIEKKEKSVLAKYKIPIIITLLICIAAFVLFGLTINTIINNKKPTNGDGVSSIPVNLTTSSDIVTSIDDSLNGNNLNVTYPDGVYVGAVVDGMREGSGELTYSNGDKYIGEFKANLFNGYGQIYYANKDIFSGNFKLGKRDGKGRINYADGSIFDGAFANDMREGEASFHAASGEIYIGSYQADKKSGYGEYYFANGEIYKGNFKNDVFEGYGEYISSDPTKNYKGEWSNGQKS